MHDAKAIIKSYALILRVICHSIFQIQSKNGANLQKTCHKMNNLLFFSLFLQRKAKNWQSQMVIGNDLRKGNVPLLSFHTPY